MTKAAPNRTLVKRLALVVLDGTCAALAGGVAAAAIIILDWRAVLVAAAVAALAGIAATQIVGLHRRVVSEIGVRDVLAMILAALLAGLVMLVFWAVRTPIGNAAAAALFFTTLWFMPLCTARVLGRLRARDRSQAAPVVIYGAGQAGLQLARALQESPDTRVVGFVDDDLALAGRMCMGLPIHSAGRLPELVARAGIQRVLLAIPSAAAARRSAVLERLAQLSVQVVSIPPLEDITAGRVSLNQLREIDVVDLLSRNVTTPDAAMMAACITDKVVLVTGAGGSIGSELCRQAAACTPRLLILYEMSEPSLYAITEELRNRVPLAAVLGSTLDAGHLKAVCRRFGVQSIYHAAAYKHVPIVEENIVEGVRNNVLSTLNVAQVASDCGVEMMALISSDKAVRPTNAMGASKRFSEMLVRVFAQERVSPRFAIVRFGNVLGSSGSVVPKFRSQIAAGGPVTVTHADVVRYFMTIREASQLVIQASAMAQSGDVFHLDMGAPVRIHDLAKRMIHLSGHTVRDADNPDGEIEIHISGLRPGEKLYEELLVDGSPEPTDHSSIWRAAEQVPDPASVRDLLARLSVALESGDPQATVAALRDAIPDFTPDPTMVDLLLRSLA